jgi:glucose/arabinose dehydrogenase
MDLGIFGGRLRQPEVVVASDFARGVNVDLLIALVGWLRRCQVFLGASITRALYSIGTALSFAIASTSLMLGAVAPAQGAWTFDDPGFFTETVTTLAPFTPIGVAWTPDGRMFIWTKGGTVRVFKGGALLPTPFIDISNKVNTVEDRGLLGLAIDPDYATNGYVYLLYTHDDDGNPNDASPKVSLLTRVTSNPSNRDVALPGSETIILGSTAVIPCPSPGPLVNCIPANETSHSIGTVRFGADGKLWVGNGDGASYSFADPLSLRSQDLNSLAGKIIRINPDGSAPTDSPNPFYDGTDSVPSKIWAYGLRNPYRFTLHPVTGIPYIGEVGWNDWEEFNKGVAGANYGWPCYEGPGTQSQYQAAFAQCRNLAQSAVTAPSYTYAHNAAGGSTAISGPFLLSNQYPSQYIGSYFLVDYTARWIRRATLDANGNIQNVVPFASNIGTSFGGLVSLELGPDGLMYYVEITTGVIGRIRHTAGGTGASCPCRV